MPHENDLVLIYFEDKPLMFARIEEILADHKPDWYHVKLLLLQVPLQVVTWILRDVYINGTEFTMNGKRMRLEKVLSPTESLPDGGKPKRKDKEGPEKTSPNSSDAKVITLSERKKR